MSAQQLLARLLTDPAVLPELLADPVALAERLGADPADAVRLSTVDRTGLRITASTARRKRVRRWQEAFPASLDLLAALDGDRRLSTGIEAVWGARDVADCARRLMDLADLLAADRPPPVLRDVVRFEVLWYRVRHGGWPHRRPRPGCPALGATVAVAGFGCPVAKVRNRIVEDRPYHDLAGRTTHYLLYLEGAHRMRALPVTGQVAGVLERCDGRTAIPELAAAVGHHPDEVRRLLRTASARGIVHCVASGGH